MNISIALVDSLCTKINNIFELSEIASEIKGHLKTIPGSKFLKDRRVENKGKDIRQKEIGKTKDKIYSPKKTEKKIPLGQLLLESKLIKEDALEEALVRHWQTGQNLGQTLIKMGLVKEEDILNMLKLQGVSK